MSEELRCGASHAPAFRELRLLACDLAPTALPSTPLQCVARVKTSEMEM